MLGPCAAYYNSSVKSCLRADPGTPTGMYDMTEIIGTPFREAFTQENAEKGFYVPGIHPFDDNIFSDFEFLSASINGCQEISSNNGKPEMVLAFLRECTQRNGSPSASAPTGFLVTKLSPEIVRPFPKREARKTEKERVESQAS